MNHIDEFQSPNFHYVAQKCFAGLLLLALIALAVNGRAARASHALVVLFAVYAGLYASRNIPVSALLLILVIGPWLSDAMARVAARFPVRWANRSSERSSSPFLARMQAIELSLRRHVWLVTTIVLTCWIAAHGGKLGATPLMDAQFDRNRFPIAAVNYLAKQNVQGPLLSPDSWGGYLIFRLYPRIRVVIDDRHDFYGEDFLKSYLKMVRLEPDWQDFIQQHPAAYVIVPKDSPLANILRESSGWQAVYNDEVAVVFLRN